MPDLSVHAVQWCSQHGHPVLALRTDDGRAFIVAMTTDDATAFAATPHASDASRAPRRLHRLVEALVAALSAQLVAVHLHVGPDDVLRASLQIDGPQGEIMLPAHFAPPSGGRVKGAADLVWFITIFPIFRGHDVACRPSHGH